ncbi:hypothetical protein [Miltoncostaea marina]|uniref:hypothetical protein n=1 Tax=Miltoncostaea marina TaxID=2843215 RepID=UPI001C3D3C9C|nr:hypothetical protein [Miltoncostaea marina]
MADPSADPDPPKGKVHEVHLRASSSATVSITDVRVTRALNAYRLTLFGVLISIAAAAGFGAASLYGGSWWAGTLLGLGVGIAAAAVTALLLWRFQHGIAALMARILPGG